MMNQILLHIAAQAASIAPEGAEPAAAAPTWPLMLVFLLTLALAYRPRER
ncbi:hypothetical protein [Parvularcula lutaonensis]|uniref:Uncharacterized protein n=1 Tax=Parvularcula lutaonensis TaxID=491923 RepID=A0ABV7M9E1_9PROT|nr:hypothetical protein [Parvularcula lutaonensis]GGY47042.1 hypothetical protein GCM10007148_15350 [Parvularcula lutaonensis]